MIRDTTVKKQLFVLYGWGVLSMKIFTGQSVFQAPVIGRLRFCLRPPHLLSAFSSLTPAAEIHRFQRAQCAAVQELAALYDRALSQVGRNYASIFAIYAMLMEDRDYQDTVCSFILSQSVTAEYATFGGETYAAAFSAMENDYMCARSADLRNVSSHLINQLIGYYEPDPLGTEPSILVDDEFSPTRTLLLDNNRLIGLVARRGNVNSHAAELASALEIPSMVCVDIPPELDGHLAMLDGVHNRLYVDPTPQEIARVEENCENCIRAARSR